MKYVFLTPWKIPKSSSLFQFCEEFSLRVSKFVPCQFICSQNQLDEKETIAYFTKEIKKLSIEKPLCFAFDENGANHNSDSFAKVLEHQEIHGEKIVIFCFGNAYGLPKELISLVRLKTICLSKLTFSHELAFAVSLEQIYRARCILQNHPYHHGEKSSLAKELNLK